MDVCVCILELPLDNKWIQFLMHVRACVHSMASERWDKISASHFQVHFNQFQVDHFRNGPKISATAVAVFLSPVVTADDVVVVVCLFV